MNPATRDHVIAATHFVLGPSNFLVLRLPQNWDLRIGRHPTDVDYTILFEGVRWAQQGQAAALLVDPKARRGIELTVRTARGKIHPPQLGEPERGSCPIGGHSAAYTLGSSNLGLFGTKHYRVLHVAYRCEETQRLIDLRFLHKGDKGTLQAILPTLEHSRCH